MFLQRQFMYFDFSLDIETNVPPVNGFGPVSLNAYNNIITGDWERLFSDKSAIDVQRPVRINPLCTIHYKTHAKIGPRKDCTQSDIESLPVILENCNTHPTGEGGGETRSIYARSKMLTSSFENCFDVNRNTDINWHKLW